MTPKMENLVFDAIERVEAAITDRECPAVIAIDGDRTLMLSDYDYLRDDAAARDAEHRAAERGRTVAARRFAIAVPKVWVATESGIQSRAVSNHPLRPGEHEAIIWSALDLDEGVDYGYEEYVRRPNGDPVFDTPRLITIPVHGRESMPGYHLIKILAADTNGSGESDTE